MALPSALHSRVRQWINAVEVVEATDVAQAQPRPGGYKFGAAGPIGSYEGQGACTVDISFAQPEARSQFEQFVSELKNFTYVWTKGSAKLMLTNCRLGPASMRNNPDSGETSVTLQIMGIGPKQVN